MDSTLLIDATPKYPMAPLALPAKQFMERARALWEELDLPTLNVRLPWYGYSLGDWNEVWDEYARNAVDGAWAKNGENTWARRRGGLTSETPARTVEHPTSAAADNHGTAATNEPR